MRLIGLLVCRNADWILPHTLPAMLRWPDALAVIVHASTDGTREIVAEHARNGRIVWQAEASEEWNQADYRQRLLDVGRSMGGTHFAVIDADEILSVPAATQIREASFELKPGECLKVPWIHCWRSLAKYRCDQSAFGSARIPFLFADAPHLAYTTNRYQMHSRLPEGIAFRDWGERDKGEGVLHMQHVDWARCEKKQADYIAQELRRWPGRRSEEEVRRQYAQALDETGIELRDVPANWWPQ